MIVSESDSPRTVQAVERQVLDVVAGLVRELGGTGAPALEDSLERDLGISSLERVELLLRIERACGVRLPDSVMAEAVTPRDIAAAIARASAPVADAPASRMEVSAPGQAAPATARTLVDVLEWHAERTPERTHIYLRLDDGTERPITYGGLLTGARSVAAGLRAIGVAAGDTIALMLRTEQAYFDAFFGVLLAGAVPVPLYPPVRQDQILEYVKRQRAILRNAAARVLVTFPEAEQLAAILRSQIPELHAVTTVDRLVAQGAGGVAHAALSSRDAALVQYTSGSTGAPKGVLLSHANLLANIRALREAIAVGPDDVTVSWLPLYHDMGLIGAWLGSLYLGVPLALMSPLAFLTRPSRWLRAIHAHRGTMSPAPNFAFDLAVRKIADEEIAGLDLSSWRLAFNGSEAVSRETIDRFSQRFAAYGFRPDAMCPVYGLAESSVGLTVPPLGREPRIDRIARAPFERERRVQQAPPDETHPLQFVSCGKPLTGHEVRITDPSGRVLGERVEGRVQFRGPSVMSGYFRNPEATRAVLHDGWADSGDLGYWANGELFITGREKDLIIVGGRNVYAQEVEDAVAEVTGVRKGCVAAFGVHDPARGTERLVVVAETRERESVRRDAIRQEALDRIVSTIGVPPDAIVIADPGAVLKTSSGKIRRSATRDAYAAGTLGRRKGLAGQWAALAFGTLSGWSARLLSWAGRVIFTIYVAAVAVLTLPILWVYLLLAAPGDRAGRAAQRWSRFALAACGIRLRVTGLEHLAGVQAGILVANHASYLDAVVLMAAIPRGFRFIAKRRLADYPLVGTVIRRARHVTIDKTDVSQRLTGADDIAGLLRENELVMIFPEGTFFRAPGVLPFRLGAFRAAVDAGRPIVPIALRGARRVLPDGTVLLRRGAIDVAIGAPLHPRAQGWPEMVRLRDAAREEIVAGSGEAARS
jgi:1-acyl-sn-glycerol-3-phosphate acyltransferase